MHEVVVMRPVQRPASTKRSVAADAGRASLLRQLRDEGRAEAVFPPTRATSTAGGESRPPDIFTIKTKDDDETRWILERLQHENPDSEVYVAPPRFILARSSGATTGSGGAAMNHWGMQAIALDQCQIDASGVTIAVVDTGVDVKHPDLAGAVQEYVNCCDKEPDDDQEGHGTHVCGIIAATGTPPNGMKGASNAKLLVFKGLARHYSATGYYRALRAACTRAKIVNLSLGGPNDDPAESLIIGQAVQAGVLVVAASGNDSDDGSYPNFPAALPGVLAVGAVDANLAQATFSNAGPHVALVAPGVAIWSTAPTYKSTQFPAMLGYAPCDGTSMAAPFVSGMAARVAAQLGTWDAQQVRDKIPLRRCPGQLQRTDELGAGMLHWPGPLDLGNA